MDVFTHSGVSGHFVWTSELRKLKDTTWRMQLKITGHSLWRFDNQGTYSKLLKVISASSRKTYCNSSFHTCMTFTSKWVSKSIYIRAGGISYENVDILSTRANLNNKQLRVLTTPVVAREMTWAKYTSWRNSTRIWGTLVLWISLPAGPLL